MAPPRLLQELFPDVASRLSRAWGLPGLGGRVRVVFSARLTRALGRAVPARGLVRLAARLERASGELVDLVLCHELAHLAAHEASRGTARPHGPEWRELMRRAGLIPSARIERPAELAPRAPRGTRYLHRCPVCGATRQAPMPMRRWRCTGCAMLGLPSTLEIARR